MGFQPQLWVCRKFQKQVVRGTMQASIELTWLKPTYPLTARPKGHAHSLPRFNWSLFFRTCVSLCSASPYISAQGSLKELSKTLPLRGHLGAAPFASSVSAPIHGYIAQTKAQVLLPGPAGVCVYFSLSTVSYYIALGWTGTQDADQSGLKL